MRQVCFFFLFASFSFGNGFLLYQPITSAIGCAWILLVT
jgi:hypothetical protein